MCYLFIFGIFTHSKAFLQPGSSSVEGVLCCLGMLPELEVSFKILLDSLHSLCEVYRWTPRSWHLTNKFSLRWMIHVKWHKMTSKCSEIESKNQTMLNSSLLGLLYIHVKSSTFLYLEDLRLMPCLVIPVVLIILSSPIINWSFQGQERPNISRTD